MDLDETIATANAGLTLISLACMVAGWRAIRRKEVARHRTYMLAAAGTAGLFMVLFVYRFARFGLRRFGGRGPWRVLYSVVLFSHEPLAVVNVPLVLAALALGLARRDAAHREVAAWALPIWVYVAATGILVHVLLTWLPA